MPATKQKAIRLAKKFLKENPNRDVLIVDNTGKFPKKFSALRFNFRFPPKKGKTNRIRFIKG